MATSDHSSSNQVTEPAQITGSSIDAATTIINNRFSIIRPLGKGGTASVVLAYDQQLERQVAIKILSESTQNHTLLQEARIQANLDHPNICKIFEIEEANQQDSNSYIIMQYIEGVSLSEWLKQQLQQNNPLDRKKVIQLIQNICDGLQTLHNQGIIHRDIKPDNIMLSEDQHLGLQPFLVDFGLANNTHHHSQHHQQLGNSTYIEGTPNYMSPEQWQNAKLDARTDIYSIGATLYLLLTGVKPLPANHANTQAQFTTSHWLSLPADIQSIIRQCLHTQRDQRYASARELNIELKRFLAGEPVSSMNSKTYWLKKKIIKHQWPVMLTSLILFSLLTFGFWQHYQQQQQQSREQLIAKFSSKLENLDASVRLSKMAAPHDITAETQQWLEQIKQLKQQTKHLGHFTYGPGHFTIGRMYYALQQYDDALLHIQKAWQSGYQQPRVAYYLALSHGAIYQSQKAKINNIPSNTRRKNQLKLLEQQHRNPAIKLLEQSLQQSPYLSFTKAQLQYYQGQYDQALTTLSQAQNLPSWFYQHHVLRGDIYLSKTHQAGIAHQNPKVQTYASKALENYAIAAQTGHSDFQLQLKPVFVSIRLLNTSIYGKQLDFKKIYHDATTALDNAAKINPNHYQIYENKGRLLGLYRKYQNQHSGDPLQSSRQEIEQFKLALSHNANDADILMALGGAYSARIKLLQQQNQAVEHLFPLAIAAFERVKPQDRYAGYYNSLALLNHEQALYQAKQLTQQQFNQPLKARNPDIDKHFDNAIKAFQQAIDKNPKVIAMYLNMGLVYRDWSYYIDPQSAKQKLQLAIKQYQKAQKFNPSHFVLNYNLTQSFNIVARINTFLNQNAENEIKQAQHYLALTQQAHPNHPFVILESANLDTLLAIIQWQNGCPYQTSLQRAKTQIDNAIIKHPNNATLLSGITWIYAIEQQLAYFSAENQLVNTEAFDQAKMVMKRNTSKQQQNFILLSLLHNKHTQFNPSDFINLPLSAESRLAYAQWLSLNQQFAQAEKIFKAIQFTYPSILWQYRLQHLNRWSKFISGNKHVDHIIDDKIKREIATLKAQLTEYFPALFTKNHKPPKCDNFS